MGYNTLKTRLTRLDIAIFLSPIYSVTPTPALCIRASAQGKRSEWPSIRISLSPFQFQITKIRKKSYLSSMGERKEKGEKSGKKMMRRKYRDDEV